MGLIANSEPPPQPGPRPAPAAATAALRQTPFVAAIGLSAFLLFSLELRAGRLVLPVFGGAPAVWTTGLCFFTAVLFLGYVYAHFVATRISFRAAAFSSSASLWPSLSSPSSRQRTWRRCACPVCRRRSTCCSSSPSSPVGRPSCSPPRPAALGLVRRSRQRSLVAVRRLEWGQLPRPAGVSVAHRAVDWPFGTARPAAGARPRVTRPASSQSSSVPDQRPRPNRVARLAAALAARRQAIWLFAALVPAGLLSATTNFLQTDLISAPLIWIGPLGDLPGELRGGVRAPRPPPRARLRLAGPGSGDAALGTLRQAARGLAADPAVRHRAGSALRLAVAIHGRLAADRPDARLLTRFYLIVTAGGALGTAFVALVAPVVFDDLRVPAPDRRRPPRARGPAR